MEEEEEEEEGMLDGGGSGATKKQRLSSRGGEPGETNGELVCGKERGGDQKKRERKKNRERSAVDMTNVDATWALEDMPQGAQVALSTLSLLHTQFTCFTGTRVLAFTTHSTKALQDMPQGAQGSAPSVYFLY